MRCTMGVALFVSAALVAGPSLAAEGPAYVVSMKLSDGDHLVGQPRLTVRAGEPARVEIRDAQGRGVSMSLTASPRAGSSSDVDIASTIDVSSVSGQQLAVKPTLMVKLGHPAVLAIGEEGGAAKPFRVDLTIEAAPGV